MPTERSNGRISSFSQTQQAQQPFLRLSAEFWLIQHVLHLSVRAITQCLLLSWRAEAVIRA